ncbi:outer membrane autotransporter protein [Luteibacter jiangsuensis]|uniref:Outer membrane autotransporter protein n=1 Tax=Luteibacter jiangsuensis TaxID=637577 RepID=A0ABT9T2R9_9GAMM|nr:autotransporter domain-containing protein [Luteibacter jiangsuensis]MDQ0011565.1 outer membrane autotransporter protein [Luteibacter jiangsuensis]
MNRIYHLVWNGTLRVVQVASELSSSRAGRTEGGGSAPPRLRPLWGAMLATGLWVVGVPAMAQVCQPTDTTTCSAQGGAAIIDRASAGGAGNGQGGFARWNTGGSGILPLAGDLASGGVGGAGATGNDNGSVFVAGGAGGAVGTLSTTQPIVGGRGGDGTPDIHVPGGGGGGGAGVYTNANYSVLLSSPVTGGAGGTGGAPTANSAAGGGGGGGGGTGAVILGDGNELQVVAGSSLVGGAGGAGGSQATGIAFGGSGGGGGDGALLFGADAVVSNGGTIRGGVGGAGGSAQASGLDGASGAGIRAQNVRFQLDNIGLVAGGNATGNGAAGIGVVTQQGARIQNIGTISGGITSGGGYATAVLFNGTDNLLTFQPGSIAHGALEVADGGSAQVDAAGGVSIDAVKLDGVTPGNASITLTPSNGVLDIASIVGTGNVTSNGGNRLSLHGVDVDGSLTLGHTGGTTLNGIVQSTGSQTYVSPITLAGDSTLNSTAANIGVQGSIDGPRALTILTQGAVTLQGAVGNTQTLSNLTVASGTLAANSIRATTLSLSTAAGGITQSGAFVISGASTFTANGDVTLTNAGNSFGGVTAQARSISLSSSSNLSVGTVNAAVSVDLAGESGMTLTGDITAPVSLSLNSGLGSVVQTAGSIAATTLTANTAGDIDLSSAGNAISVLGDVAAGDFSLASSSPLTVAGALVAQRVTFAVPSGVVVTGSIDAGLVTDIDAGGSLTIGNGGANGTLSGDVANNGVLTYNRTGTVSFTGALGGSGQLIQQGSGTLLFDGDATPFLGSTQVQAGKLVVGSVAGSNAVLVGNVSVANGATLGGHGRINGDVTMNTGSVLSPGNSIGTLTVNGDLTMALGTQMDVELGAAGNGDKVVVNGDLALNGVTLDVTDAGGMGPGVYNIFAYSGALTTTNGGLSFGTTPAGHALQLQTLTGAKQINILDVTNTTLQFWNANGLASPTQMGGGDGTWSTTSPTWTDQDGSITGAMSPQPGFAVFGGAAGAVAVDGGSGQVSATGMQFLSDGYRLSGDPILLTSSSGTPVIRVGDGSATSAGYVATIDSVLEGTQGLAKNDAGTLVLGGINTYSGDTIVNGGTLSVGDDRNLGDAANGIALNGGALRVTGTTYAATGRDLALTGGGAVDIADASNTFTWNGDITGAGVLEKQGAGTLALDHANAYTGGTLVSAGTLRLGDSGAIGSGTLSLASGSTLAFAANGLAVANAVTVAGTASIDVGGTDTATLGGVIADGTTAGGFTKTGAGELLLTGDNTYTGITTIDAGTLHVGDGGTHGSVVGDIVDHGTLLLDRSDDVTYAGALSGEGAFRKLGAGALHLTGDSGAFTGNTDVTGGTLRLDGKLGGNLSMASGTVLAGTGTGGSVVLQSGAEVSPGGEGVPATLSFTGDFTMAAGTRYTVDVTDAGQGDRIDVAGHASLAGGSVVSLGTGGNWGTSTTYTILSAADGVSGTFGAVSTDLAFLTPSLSYTANAVNLTLRRNAVAFPDVAMTRNQRATAGATEALGAGASLYDAILRLDAASARAAFDSLSGEIHASTRTAIADDQRYQREAINNHLLDADAAREGEGVSAWASAWGHWGHHDGDGNAARMSASGGGLLVGADTVVGSATRVGFALGTGQISASTPARDASADIRTRTAGLYAGGREDAFQWQAGALYGQQKIRTHRTATLDDLSARIGSDDDAHTAQGYVEGAYVIDGTRGSWAPFVNVAYQQLRTPTIHERGSIGALDVDADRSHQTFGTLGLRGEAKLGDTGTAVFASLGWRHAWGDVDSTARMRFAGNGTSFDIQGVPIADDAGVVTAGLRFRPAPSVTIDATYSGQFASDAKDQSARLSLSWAF